MPIKHSRVCFKPHCQGFRWLVVDEKRLAECVAQVALGQHRLVRQALHELGPTSGTSVTNHAIDSAVAKLRNTDGENRYHRDGWLFQLVSWVALAVKSDEHAVLDAPHPQPAQKGLDGLCVQLSATHDKIEYVLVCEDKATKNPRNTFLEQVLPGIREIVNGGRDDELLSRLTTLIERCTTDNNQLDAMLAHAHWQPKLRFRACFCTSESRMPKEVILFEGFEKEASGDIHRRLGELLIEDDFRDWLDAFAGSVIVQLEELREIS